MEEALKSEEHWKKNMLVSYSYGGYVDTGFSAGSLVRFNWRNENGNIPQVSH